MMAGSLQFDRVGSLPFTRLWVIACWLLVFPIPGSAAEQEIDHPTPADTAPRTADRPGHANSDVEYRGTFRRLGSRSALPDYHKRWGVIVGIDNYSREAKLDFAENDAREIRQILIDEFGFQQQNILYLPGTQATLEGMQRAFDTWLPARQTNENDLVLAFFAGHGFIDAATRKGYLGAVGSSSEEMSTTCLAVSWLRDRLQQLPCRHKMIVLDCCYSGTLFGKLPDAEKTESAFFGISAGRETPVADGGGENRHSVFTAALLRVLRERANTDRPDHAFTFREFAPLVYSEVRSDPKSRQVPEFGRLIPGSGDIVFRPTFRRSTPREVARVADYGNRVAAAQLAQLQDNLPHAVEFLLTCPPELRGWEWRYLRHVAGENLVSEKLAGGPPSRISCSPDGQLIAVAGEDKTVKLFDATSGQFRQTLKGHTGNVNAIAFSPNGSLIGSAGDDRTIRIWRGPSFEVMHVLRGHSFPVHAVAFHPEQSCVVSGGGLVDSKTGPLPRGELKMWDTDTGRLLHDLEGHDSAVIGVAFNPGSFQLATASAGGLEVMEKEDGATAVAKRYSEVRLWAAKDRSLLRTFGQRSARIRSIAYHPDGEKIVVTRPNDAIRLWDSKGEQVELEIPYPGYRETTNVVFSPDGTLIAGGSANETIQLWDSASGQKRRRLREHGGYPCHLAFLATGQLASVSWTHDDSVLKTWDTHPVRGQRTLLDDDPYVMQLAFLSEPLRLAVASVSRPLLIWDLSADQPIEFPQVGSPAGISITPDAKRVVARVRSGVTLADLGTSEVQPIYRAPVQVLRSSCPPTISKNGRWLAYPTVHGEMINIHDLQNNSPALAIPTRGLQPSAVRFDPTNEFFVLAGILVPENGRRVITRETSQGMVRFYRVSEVVGRPAS